MQQWRHMNIIASQITVPSFDRLFMLTIKKTPKLCVTGPLWGEFTSGFPSQRASNAESFPMWWHHHEETVECLSCMVFIRVTKSFLIPAIKSLVPGRCGSNFKIVIYEHILLIQIMSTSCEITLRGMPENMCDDKSTLVQVVAWCHQAPSHYLSQCWLWSVSPYGITRPQ